MEALLDLAEASLAAPDVERVERAQVVVHIDADALSADGRGRTELEDGPVDLARDGAAAGLRRGARRPGGARRPAGERRTQRRTVPPALRRLLEARDEETCCFPGCERRRHLQAHHRQHWAHGGETSLDNLVLLCFHHHRLVHEGGYTVEDDGASGLRFRNRHGVLCSALPPRPPPGSADDLLAEHHRLRLEIGPKTNRNGGDSPFDLGYAVSAISSAAAA